MQPQSAARPAATGTIDPQPLALLELTLAGERQALEPARLAVRDFLAPHRPTAQTLYNVELVLEETLMNVVWHAYGSAPGRHIGLRVQVLDDQILLQFDDDGVAFDPLQAAELPLPASIGEARTGGLGLRLVRRLARSVAYERRGGRNCLSIAIART